MKKVLLCGAALAVAYVLGARPALSTGPNYDAMIRHAGGTQPWLNVTVTQTFASQSDCNTYVSTALYYDRVYFNMPSSAGYCLPHP